MVANAIQKTFAFDREASFGDQTAKNWDSLTANGSTFFCFDLNYDEIKQEAIANKNLKTRAAASHAPFLGLRGGPYTFSFYWHGTAANAAENAQASRIPQDEMLFIGLGGELLGFRSGLAGGTAAAPDVDAGQGANLEPFGWSFFYDVSASAGYYRCYESIATDTLTMAPGHTLPFTPDAGGADTAYAAVVHYPDWDALEDHTHASHETLTLFFKGRQTDDNVECKGCKHGIEFGPIEAGVAIEIKVAGEIADFDHENVSQPDLTGTPAGSPGRVVGSGVATICSWAVADALLATQNFWGTMQFTCGIKPELVRGPGGLEGKHGFGLTEDSYDATMITVTVPYSDDYAAEYRAETRRHLLVQVGTDPLTSRFLYMPNLAYAEEPKRVSVSGRAGSELKFLCRERDVAQGALTDAEYHRARAKFVMGRTG